MTQDGGWPVLFSFHIFETMNVTNNELTTDGSTITSEVLIDIFLPLTVITTGQLSENVPTELLCL